MSSFRSKEPGMRRFKTIAGLFGVVWLAAPLAAQAAEAAVEHGAHELKDQLVPPTIWAIASFLVVLFVIWKKLLPKINAGLDQRAAQIREALAAATRARAEAEEAMKRHQADLEAARREARAIIDEGKADAERVKADIVQSAHQEKDEILVRARREIGLAKAAALEDLHHRSVELAFDLAERLIEKSLRPEDHEVLIRDRINALKVEA
jgi:F-type H+-transporting ATPase subunit b